MGHDAKKIDLLRLRAATMSTQELEATAWWIEKAAALLVDMTYSCDVNSLKRSAERLIEEVGYRKHLEATCDKST